MPLEGIKVIDLAQVLAGPFGAAMLGDLGAEVIKVESLSGDESRHLGVGLGLDSAMFIGANRNKRGIALDLRTEGGRDVLYNLLKGADIVIDNMRPSSKQKLGIDYDSLANINERLISISISAFGASGPYAGRGGIDPLAQALGGLMATTGLAGEPPLKVGSPIIDATAAHLVVISAMASLRRRDYSGVGESIELNLLDTIFNLQPTTMSQYLVGGHEPPAVGCSSDLMAPYGLFKSREGRFWQLVSLNQKFFSNLCEALECQYLLDDQRYLTNKDRLENQSSLDQTIAELMSKFDSQELEDRFQRADVLAAPVKSIAEAAEDPQLLHNDMITTIHHARLGDIKSGKFPIKFSGESAAQQPTPAPTLGQHNESILMALGYSESDIKALANEGVIGKAP